MSGICLSVRSAPALACLALLVALLLIQQFGQVTGAGLLGSAISNALHVPLFACITLLLARLLPDSGPWALLGAAAGLAVLSEAAQLPTSRDASFGDLLRDLLGAGPVVFALWWQQTHRRPLFVWLVTVGLLFALTCAGPAAVVAAYWSRDQCFPVVFHPDMEMMDPLWWSNGSVERVVASNAAAFEADHALEITWHDERYPGIHFVELASGWPAHEVLLVDVFVPIGPAMPLTAAVQFDDTTGTAASVKRYARAGRTTLEYPVGELLKGRATSPGTLILHTDASQAGRRLLLGRIQLASEYARPESTPQ